MIRNFFYIAYAILICMISHSCSYSSSEEKETKADPDPEVFVRMRDDGTRSSANQIDNNGMVNGIRITYYADGKTIHSKTTFNQGIKQGPSNIYDLNGKIFQQTNYEEGKKLSYKLLVAGS